MNVLPQGGAPPCATHPDRPATGICQRCGNYTCGLCTDEGRQAMCAACRERLGLTAFPMSRERWSVEDIVGYGWHVFKREWGSLILASCIFFGCIVLLATAFAIAQSVVQAAAGERFTLTEAFALSGLYDIAQLLLTGWLQLGFFAIAIEALEGRPFQVAMLFGQYRKVGKLLIQWLVVALAFAVVLGPLGGGLVWWITHGAGSLSTSAIAVLALAGLVAFVASIYGMIGLFFMQMELALDDEVGPLEAIRRSWIIAKGKRGWIILLGLIAGVIAAAGLAACCVGVVATFGIGELIVVGLYLALRNGADVPAPTRLRDR